MTQKEYIEKCKKVNPEYDYSEINFISTTKTKFVYPICKKHGKFKFNVIGLYNHHISCPECDRIKRFNEFKEKAIKIHSNKYQYDEKSYITNKKQMTIICPKHGEFKQCPGDHLKGWGCSKCSKKYKPSTKEWVDKVKHLYGDKYNYDKVNYIDNKTNVIITCKLHGDFLVTPSNHIKGNGGCPKCCSNFKHNLHKKSTEQFINDAKKIHGKIYDYSKVNYYNKCKEVEIICKKHGSFFQTPSSHLSGFGCCKCLHKRQTLLYNKLCQSFTELNLLYEKGNEWLQKMRFDIYCPEYNFAVEYDGEQHYIPLEIYGGIINFNKIKERDLLKNNLCIKNKCKLFRVKYNYTDNDYNELVKNIESYIYDPINFSPELSNNSKITII